MSSLGLYLAEKLVLTGNVFSHIITNCTRCGRCVKGNVASIPLHCSFTVLILHSTSATCSFVALMLTFTWDRRLQSFSKSISINMVCTMNPACACSCNTLVGLIAYGFAILLGIHSTVVKPTSHP